MSRESVEVVRRWGAAMTEGPEATAAAVAELWDSELDFYPVRKFAEAEPCHGHEEMLRFMREFQSAYTRVSWEPHEVIAVGDDRVFSRFSLRAEGRASGLEIDGDVYLTAWLRHGRLLRVENHVTMSGALHSLGLEGDTLEAAGLRADR